MVPGVQIRCSLEAEGQRRLQATPYGVAERSSGASELGEGVVERVAEDADVAAITEWELDFSSRPLLDDRGKKVWELVVCDSKRQLEFTRFFPNNVINSVTLRDTLSYIFSSLGVPKPLKIRYFRYVSLMDSASPAACLRWMSVCRLRIVLSIHLWMSRKPPSVVSVH